MSTSSEISARERLAALAARGFVHSPAGDPDAAPARSIYALALDRGDRSPPLGHIAVDRLSVEHAERQSRRTE